MSKILEFLAFIAWWFGVTWAAVQVFRTLALLLQAADLPDVIAGPLWLLALSAFVATWYFVGSRSLRLIQRYYDWKREREH